MKQLILSFFLSISLLSAGQLEIQELSLTSDNLRSKVQDLVGDGIIITNISTNQSSSSKAIGTFSDKRRTFGMSKGILATTGSVSRVAQFNAQDAMSAQGNEGNRIQNGWRNHQFTGTRVPELEEMLGEGRTTDGLVLEMDIIAIADTLVFTYIFGSEEYDEYVCSQFNDAFAFFISGDGIQGEKNIALIPGTDIPVSINNVNNGNPGNAACEKSNSSFYMRNEGVRIEYDGFTRLLEVKQAVTPYARYHLKLCIADVGDNALDSGILLEQAGILSYHEDLSVFFESNSAILSNQYKAVLDRVPDLMQKHRVRNLLVSGHTDGIGSDEFNFQLANARAKAVFNYLVSIGVGKDSIQVRNRGETMPYADNSSASGRSINRRVDVRLLGNNETFEKETTEMPDKPELDQNVPNPFTERSNIRYSVPENIGHAELLITTMDGKIVEKVVILERGEGNYNLEGYKYAAGTFLCTLITDGRPTESIRISHN